MINHKLQAFKDGNSGANVPEDASGYDSPLDL
jgi:hypothetical protein